MDWTEVKIEVNADDIDRAAAIANMAVPYGIYIEDYRNLEEETREIANIDLIDEGLLQKDRTKGIFTSIFRKKKPAGGGGVSFGALQRGGHPPHH